MRTCGDAGGLRADGTPCRSTLGLGEVSGRCMAHDPERADEALRVRQAGGRAAGVSRRLAKAALPEDVPSPPRTLADAVRWSSWVAHAVAVGRVDGRTGHEIIFALNCLRGALEKRDLLAEIEGLRGELDALRKGQRGPRAS